MTALSLAYDVNDTINILDKLLLIYNTKASHLAEAIGVSPSTISRLLNSKTTKRPKESVLEKIANHFNITLDQLKGLQTISWDKLGILIKIEQSLKVPLYNWTYCEGWENARDIPNKDIMIATDLKDLGKHAFALKVKDHKMEPMFPLGSILICDADKEYKYGSFVIAKINDCQEVVFRKLYIDMGRKILMPLNNEIGRLSAKAISDCDQILGVVVQCKFNLQ